MPSSSRRPGIAFLLAQLGADATGRFADALAPAGITPPVAGVLRLLRVEAGMSQQDLARRLGVAPSRVVAVVDELEERGWVARTRGSDRRTNALALTPAGEEAFGRVAAVAAGHERAVTEGLAAAEREQLLALLERLAALRGLVPGVHPGYRRP
ncbi:DNA-binding MarR family transcriptional regulator [Motilibacter rhizosphaerae]|uniref:DNA-binding MarR family transcriptional regulator n=1 Tax=Motilibacter rhizosphaerae TaxID=598652 RepID=A0A4Q7NRE5_9ACTN|nr:MarR family transcriptional regulator [Motilibacter rhizosphaerae]RZS89636.1 DNA-binding MarR family transcriptional regulator [Motilibacter rhizosphaerae]